MNDLEKKLFTRKYKKLTVCQLPGCKNKLTDRNKYCCTEHAEEAKKLYKKIWSRNNKDKVKKHNHNYWIKKNENKQVKTYQF